MTKIEYEAPDQYLAAKFERGGFSHEITIDARPGEKNFQ